MAEASFNPVEQFEVKDIFSLPHISGYNINFTNASLGMVLAVLLITLFMGLGTRTRSLVPGRLQSMVEMVYRFVYNTHMGNTGPEGLKYFPVIFSLFIFVIFCNLLGDIPYPHGFAVTSHIIVTFALAAFVFVGITCIGFYKHGLHFFSFFLPKGLPGGLFGLVLSLLMIVIELLSYMARPISLSLRLAANMMAGHILLKVIASFIAVLGIFGLFPFTFLTMFIAFEIFVACLQAYIFALLCSIYLNDALHLH